MTRNELAILCFSEYSKLSENERDQFIKKLIERRKKHEKKLVTLHDLEEKIGTKAVIKKYDKIIFVCKLFILDENISSIDCMNKLETI